MSTKPRRILVMRRSGDVRIYESAKACARGENINLFTVYEIIYRGYNNRGDKFEYAR